MAKKDDKMMAQVGSYAFIIGVVLAIVAGFFGGALGAMGIGAGLIAVVLGILGLLVGLLNVSERETVPFLVAAVAITVSMTALISVVNSIVGVLGVANGITQTFANISVFVAPAAAIVALKAIWDLAKEY